MCEDLDDELNSGHSLAGALCEHLDNMGANSLEIPVDLDGRRYIVSARVVW